MAVRRANGDDQWPASRAFAVFGRYRGRRWEIGENHNISHNYATFGDLLFREARLKYIDIQGPSAALTNVRRISRAAPCTGSALTA